MPLMKEHLARSYSTRMYRAISCCRRIAQYSHCFPFKPHLSLRISACTFMELLSCIKGGNDEHLENNRDRLRALAGSGSQKFHAAHQGHAGLAKWSKGRVSSAVVKHSPCFSRRRMAGSSRTTSTNSVGREPGLIYATSPASIACSR